MTADTLRDWFHAHGWTATVIAPDMVRVERDDHDPRIRRQRRRVRVYRECPGIISTYWRVERAPTGRS